MSRRSPPSKFQNQKCAVCAVSAWHKNFFIGGKFSSHQLLEGQNLCFVCYKKTKNDDAHNSSFEIEIDQDIAEGPTPYLMKRFKKKVRYSNRLIRTTPLCLI